MLAFGSTTPGSPIPPVDADDLRRVWSFISISRKGVPTDSEAAGKANPALGLNMSVLAQQCHSSKADVLAVYFRSLLIDLLLEQGLLEQWREGDKLRAIIFAGLAEVPLPRGLESFKAKEFVASLPQAR